MGDQLNLLPDDILCVILSFLTLRDAIKTRLVSRRWRSLSPSLDILTLDEVNVFGSKDDKKQLGVVEYQTRFVKAIDQFLESFEPRSNNLRTLEVHFLFEKDFALNINRWVASFRRMKVEKVDLNLCWQGSPPSEHIYFPSNFSLPDNKASNLRHLSLVLHKSGHFSEFSSDLRSLKSLVLIGVPLDQSDIDSILSHCPNLVVLKLLRCQLPIKLYMHCEHSCLKMLAIDWCDVWKIELHSPSLETFELSGCTSSSLSLPNVPLLKRIYLDAFNSLTVHTFARAPNLEVFSLFLMSEVRPIKNHSMVWKWNALKQLDLTLALPREESDPLVSMDRLLVASPFLEVLNLEMFHVHEGCEPRQEYCRRLYPHLREVHIKGCRGRWCQMQVVSYLLKAAINLKRMVISVTEEWFFDGDPKSKVHDFLQSLSMNLVAQISIV